jgi:formiminotetrahydrofolate cyclodeaminase
MGAKDHIMDTVGTYLKELSERRMTPGGGSAAALTAALGVGLNLMVINYSIKKDAPEETRRGFTGKRQQQEESLECLSSLVNEDCRAFEELMGALSDKRDAQKEFCAAGAVPMKICRECHVSMDIAFQLIKDSNRNLVTDVGCAAHILKAAFNSARLNVEINLKQITDSAFVEDAEKTLRNMSKDIDHQEGEIQACLKNIMDPED